MGESCQHKLLCSCRNASEIRDFVKNKIERCIQKYMSLEETVTYLKDKHQISQHLTKPIWEQLQRESPDFFKNYYLRCKIALQTKMFNDMLAKQVALMLEHGNLDICDASPALTTFLHQHPEGIRLMAKLANTSYIGAQTVAQAATTLEDPSAPEFRGDIEHNGLIFQDTEVELLALLQDITLSAEQLLDLSGPYQPQLQLQQNFSLEEQQILQNSSSNGLQYGGGSNGPQYGGGSNELQYGGGSNRLQYGGGRPQYGGGSNGPQYGGRSNEPQYGGRSNELQYGGGSNGLQYGGSNGPQYRGGSNQYGGGSNGLQYGGGSNELQHGESIDQQLCHSLDTNQSMRMYTSVNPRKARRVILPHHPESEALNNPDSGGETLTTGQNQHDLQRKEQRRGP